MFRFTQEQSSRSQSQCLAKITSMVPLCMLMYVRCQCYGVIFQPVLCVCVFVVRRAGRYSITFLHGEPHTHTHTHTHTHNKLEYAAIVGNAHINKHSGTLLVILAKHSLRLSDDGSCVNRNTSEQIL